MTIKELYITRVEGEEIGNITYSGFISETRNIITKYNKDINIREINSLIQEVSAKYDELRYNSYKEGFKEYASKYVKVEKRLPKAGEAINIFFRSIDYVQDIISKDDYENLISMFFSLVDNDQEKYFTAGKQDAEKLFNELMR